MDFNHNPFSKHMNPMNPINQTHPIESYFPGGDTSLSCPIRPESLRRLREKIESFSVSEDAPHPLDVDGMAIPPGHRNTEVETWDAIRAELAQQISEVEAIISESIAMDELGRKGGWTEEYRRWNIKKIANGQVPTSPESLVLSIELLKSYADVTPEIFEVFRRYMGQYFAKFHTAASALVASALKIAQARKADANTAESKIFSALGLRTTSTEITAGVGRVVTKLEAMASRFDAQKNPYFSHSANVGGNAPRPHYEMLCELRPHYHIGEYLNNPDLLTRERAGGCRRALVKLIENRIAKNDARIAEIQAAAPAPAEPAANPPASTVDLALARAARNEAAEGAEMTFAGTESN